MSPEIPCEYTFHFRYSKYSGISRNLCLLIISHILFFFCLSPVFRILDYMSSPALPSLEARDCGTQLRDRHLAPHLRNFEVVNPSGTTIFEERNHTKHRRLSEPPTRKVSVQTGRFGPTSKKGILKCMSIKYPSAACLERLAKRRTKPSITNCEVVTSNFKKGFCSWLLDRMKRQDGEDPLFKRIGENVYARLYGPDWDEISATLQINP